MKTALKVFEMLALAGAVVAAMGRRPDYAAVFVGYAIYFRVSNA